MLALFAELLIHYQTLFYPLLSPQQRRIIQNLQPILNNVELIRKQLKFSQILAILSIKDSLLIKFKGDFQDFSSLNHIFIKYLNEKIDEEITERCDYQIEQLLLNIEQLQKTEEFSEKIFKICSSWKLLNNVDQWINVITYCAKQADFCEEFPIIMEIDNVYKNFKKIWEIASDDLKDKLLRHTSIKKIVASIHVKMPSTGAKIMEEDTLDIKKISSLPFDTLLKIYQRGNKKLGAELILNALKDCTITAIQEIRKKYCTDLKKNDETSGSVDLDKQNIFISASGSFTHKIIEAFSLNVDKNSSQNIETTLPIFLDAVMEILFLMEDEKTVVDWYKENTILGDFSIMIVENNENQLYAIAEKYPEIISTVYKVAPRFITYQIDSLSTLIKIGNHNKILFQQDLELSYLSGFIKSLSNVLEIYNKCEISNYHFLVKYGLLYIKSTKDLIYAAKKLPIFFEELVYNYSETLANLIANDEIKFSNQIFTIDPLMALQLAIASYRLMSELFLKWHDKYPIIKKEHKKLHNFDAGVQKFSKSIFRISNHNNNTLIPLDLAVSSPFKKSIKQSLIETDLLKQYKFNFTNRFMTKGQYTDAMQFGKSGYYSKGHIVFSKPGESGGDYLTFSRKDNNLAHSFAEYLYEIWLQQNDEKFYVLEIGPGEGDLCKKIINYIADKAKSDDSWKKFLNTLEYTLLEKAEALHKRQKITLCDQIKKINFLQGDVLNLSDKFFKKSPAFHVVISNELLDMFPMEEIQLSKTGEILVAQVIVGIDSDFLKNYLSTLTSKKIESFLNEMMLNKRYLISNVSKKDIPDNPLSAEQYLILHQYFSDYLDTKNKNFTEQFKKIFDFKTIYSPVENFPTIVATLERYPDLVEGLTVNKSKLISPFLENYVIALKKMCRGITINIDYGKHTWSLNPSTWKTYYKSEQGQDVFFNPGYVDITADVDFTHFCASLKKMDFEKIAYFSQKKFFSEKLGMTNTSYSHNAFKVAIHKKKDCNLSLSLSKIPSLPTTIYGVMKKKYEKSEQAFEQMEQSSAQHHHCILK